MKTLYDYDGAAAGESVAGRDYPATTTLLAAAESLHPADELLRMVTDHMTDLVLMIDKDVIIQYASPSVLPITGYSVEERLGKSASELIHPDDLPRIAQLATKASNPAAAHRVEYRLRHADGHYIWLETTASVLLGDDHAFNGAVMNIRDITERKELEQKLQRALDEMEERIRDRTAQLEEANMALSVLLKRRTEDQVALEERLQRNINDLVLPLLALMRRGNLGDRERNCLKLLEANLSVITSPFLHTLSAVYGCLSPQEVRIAQMIRDGLDSRQIAELIGINKATVEKHRNNIRKKLGLVREKTNLRSYLLSIS